MEPGEWQKLLDQGASTETWQAIVEAIIHNFQQTDFDTVLPLLEEGVASWPDEIRIAPNAFLPYGLDRSQGVIARIARRFDEFKSTHFTIESLSKHLKHPIVINHLTVTDRGDWSGYMSRLIRKKYAENVRSLYIYQLFGTDGFGAALASKHFCNLEHFQIYVEGQEAYCDSHGLSASSKIDRPRLRSLCNGYYPLDPARVSVLRKAKLPMIEAVNLTLIAGGGLKELVSADWFPQLKSLQWRGTDSAENNGRTNYRAWLKKHLPGFRSGEDTRGQRFLEDGRARFDFDVEALAHSPRPLALKRLVIRPNRNSPLTTATLTALQTATALPHLEKLWLPVPAGTDADDVRRTLLAAPGLPKLSEVHCLTSDRSEPWNEWTLEGSDKKLVLPPYSLIDLTARV